jgi:hypothetical protein
MAYPETESLGKVQLAMGDLHRQFEERINLLRQQGKDEKALLELVKGEMAMKDAAGIYLSWAAHYIERLAQSEHGEGISELDEGSNV